MEPLRALANEWGRMAEQLLREPAFGTVQRAYNDARVMTLRTCKKQLIETLADLRATAHPPQEEE